MGSSACRISIRVIPNANQNAVVGLYGDGWKVRVQASPERGKANVMLCKFVAETAGIRFRDVVIVMGLHSNDKVLELEGINRADLEDRLELAKGTMGTHR